MFLLVSGENTLLFTFVCKDKIKDISSKVIVYIRFIIRYVVYKISQISQRYLNLKRLPILL